MEQKRLECFMREKVECMCMYVSINTKNTKGTLVVNRRREPGLQQNSMFCQH